jgi:hypothetical protein
MNIENDLSEKLKRIFGVQRVTFNLEAADAIEQETLFVQLQSNRASFGEGIERARVTGSAFIYAQQKKFPLNFLMKRIKNADQADVKDIFFSDIEETDAVFQNLVRRSFSFLYFFSGQYDPDNGIIEEIVFNEGET